MTDTYFDIPVHHSVTSQPAIVQMIRGQIQADLTLKGLQDKRMWAILRYKASRYYCHNIYSGVTTENQQGFKIFDKLGNKGLRFRFFFTQKNYIYIYIYYFRLLNLTLHYIYFILLSL